MAGALISFHCYVSSSVSNRIISSIAFLNYGVGMVLLNFGNFHDVGELESALGTLFTVLGFLMFLGICIVNVRKCFTFRVPSVHFFSGPDRPVYIFILVCNWISRGLFFALSTGTAEARDSKARGAYIVINTITVLLISVLHSRQTKEEIGSMKVFCSAT
jgi:hypothetical protein